MVDFIADDASGISQRLKEIQLERGDCPRCKNRGFLFMVVILTCPEHVYVCPDCCNPRGLEKPEPWKNGDEG